MALMEAVTVLNTHLERKGRLRFKTSLAANIASRLNAHTPMLLKIYEKTYIGGRVPCQLITSLFAEGFLGFHS